MTDLHRTAAAGYTAQAATYVTGRPDYPQGIAEWLRDALGLATRSRALDLGSGTGKFLPFLAATGADVVAVEPVDGMRAELAERHPEVEAHAGTAQSIPLPDASLDAVVCAQSFHWFASEPALAEIRRVLKVGGRLGLVWNVRDEGVPWVAALSALTDPHEGGVPRYRTGAWRRLFPADGFSPLEETRLPHAHAGSPEDVIVGRTLSVSFIAALPAAEREAVASQVRALVAATPELAGRETVRFPYETCAFSCTRTA